MSEKTGHCGCYCCLAAFPESEIWGYAGTDAICPYCMVDSVIVSDNPIEDGRLEALKAKWFGDDDEDLNADDVRAANEAKAEGPARPLEEVRKDLGLSENEQDWSDLEKDAMTNERIDAVAKYLKDTGQASA